MDEIVFEAYNTDQAPREVLQPGRYKFKVTNIKKVTSRSGRDCVRVSLDIYTNEGTVRRTDTICIQRRYDWRWRQFLFAIGIRKRGEFKVTAEEIIGKEGYVDIVQRERSINGGVLVVDTIRGYYPTDGVVKVADVPPEEPGKCEVKSEVRVEKGVEVKSDIKSEKKVEEEAEVGSGLVDEGEIDEILDI